MCSTPNDLIYIHPDPPAAPTFFCITYRVKSTGESIESETFSGEFEDCEAQAKQWCSDHLAEHGEIADYCIEEVDPEDYADHDAMRSGYK